MELLDEKLKMEAEREAIAVVLQEMATAKGLMKPGGLRLYGAAAAGKGGAGVRVAALLAILQGGPPKPAKKWCVCARVVAGPHGVTSLRVGNLVSSTRSHAVPC
jgi:hypothetical protein